MLSYRHAFHAGNHADVLKHLCLVLALEHLLKKDKPLCYIDTHAGPGLCALDQGHASKNSEFESGISRLINASGLPDPLNRYLKLISAFNQDGELKTYPGSPALARQLLGPGHRMELSELHPTDYEALRDWAGRSRQVRVEKADGFQRLKALLPPMERRAMVLIDPPYEIKQDYTGVVTALQGAMRRFASGVYLLWYPMLNRPEIPGMLRALKQLPARQLQVELCVHSTAIAGMFGSGIFMINPPFQVAEQLQACEPALLDLLAQDDRASIQVTERGMA